VRDTVPVGLEQVLIKALARVPADRYATAQQLAEALETARPSAATPSAPVPAMLPSAGAVYGGPATRWRMPVAVAAVALLGAGAGVTLTWRHFASAAPDLPVTRFAIQPPQGDSIFVRSPAARSLDISPDGRRIVYVDVRGSDTVSRLDVRDLRTGLTTPLAGTERAYAPFFRPDGEWIGYFEDGTRRLMKVSAEGGQPQLICDCGPSVGADWGRDGWIVFDPGNERQLTGLQRVKETGGRPEALPASDTAFSAQVWGLVAPRLLPDGKTALVSAVGGGAPRVSAVSLETGRRTDIVSGAWAGQYVDPGILVYAKAMELWAVHFDLRKLAVVGEPVRVLDSMQSTVDAWAEYALSPSGTLVYSRPVGVTGQDGTHLVWLDRSDRIERIEAIPGGCWVGPRLSPDGGRIVYWGWPYETCGGTSGGRVWLYDRARGAPRAITDEAYTSAWPIFSRDGRSVVSNSNREEKNGFPLYRTTVDGGGSPERLTHMTRDASTALMHQPDSWTPDGETLAYQQGFDPKTWYDIYLVSVTGRREARPLLATKANERLPMFSPDGRWLAYVSDESGRSEVYVRRYPAFDQPVQVTREGGDGPAWSADGRELFFEHAQGLYAVAFADGRTGEPRQLVNLRQRGNRNALIGPGTFGRTYDVARSGRFLMTQLEANTPNGTEYQVVVNWLTELRHRLAERQARP
jgi:serine/threonine-protein kinase